MAEEPVEKSVVVHILDTSERSIIDSIRLIDHLQTELTALRRTIDGTNECLRQSRALLVELSDARI